MNKRTTLSEDDPDVRANRIIIDGITNAMHDAGLNATELAERSGLAQPTVHRILNYQSKDPKLSILRKMARALNLTIEELFVGTKTKTHSQYSIADTGNPPGYKVDNLKIRYGEFLKSIKVPMINWSDIPTVMENGLPNRRDTACPVEFGTGTFACKLESPAMQSPTGPSYPAGTTLFVDPTTRQKIQHGDPVLIILNEDGRKGAAMRIYQLDGTDEYLMPLNIGFPAITRATRKFEIVGKVIYAVI